MFESSMWVSCGLISIGLELLIPGAFFVWIGFAALMMSGIVSFLNLSWPLQALLFFVLSLLLLKVGKSCLRRISPHTTLNRRGDSLIGKVFALSQSLQGGHGRMNVGDSVWSIEGPDLPEGTPVIVRSVEGNTLRVEKRD